MIIELRSERLVLLPQRAVYWEREKTLLIADPHFGKPETFRAAAVPVPHGSTARALKRLDIALDTTAAQRLVVLGDFWHARAGQSLQLLDELSQWRANRPQLRIDLVMGNHDRRANAAPSEWNLDIHVGGLVQSPFLLRHFPDRSDLGYVLAGHLHPAINLGGPRQRLRLPCFWFGADVGVLPAFGEFTGTADIHPAPGDRVWVVADDEVLTVPLPS